MYIILGDEQAVLTFRKCMNTINYPIIIADIAPRVPSSLTHFNWPRLLRQTKLQGLIFFFVTRPTLIGLT